jgi:hypothetical protein
MKVYLKNTNVVVDVENPNKELQYIPIHNSKFVFVGDSVKIFDYTDEDESSFTDAIANLKNESGSLIGNKDQVANYLSDFVGSPALVQSNEATHEELTNPAGVSYADFKELSFVCDGTIDVTINGVTIQYPKTMGGVTVLGETLKADLSAEYSVRFTGTGSVLVTQLK